MAEQDKLLDTQYGIEEIDKHRGGASRGSNIKWLIAIFGLLILLLVIADTLFASQSLLGQYLPVLAVLFVGGGLWQLFRAFMRGDIQTRLLIAVISIVLFTAIVITTSSIVTGFQTRQKEAIQQLEVVADFKQEEVADLLDSLKTTLAIFRIENTRFYYTQIILQGTALNSIVDSFRQTLDETLEQTTAFDELFLVNTNGVVVLSTDPANEGQVVKDRAYFQLNQAQPFIQPPQISSTSDQVAMFVAQPIIEPNADSLGVLVGRVNLEQLNKIVAGHERFGESTKIYLVNRNNILVAGLDTIEVASSQNVLDSEGITQGLNKNDNSGLYDDFRGDAVIGVYRWLPELDTVLLVEQNQSEAFQPVFTTLTVNIIIALVAILVAIVIGLATVRAIAPPLSRLAETSTKIAAGDLDLRATVERQDEIGEVAQAFNKMTARLRDLIGGLEKRVADRTRALETQATISTQLTGLLNEEQILAYVVDYLQQEFDFYHTHIYLIESETQDLVMAKGAGEVGRKLKAQNHRLAAGQGIVGTVAATNKPFVSNNVNEVLNFVRNPLLPETQSEIAVPLRKGDQVLGVLDIQSERINQFNAEDQSLLQSVANQTATAIDSARQIAKAQGAVQEVERLNRQLLRESWEQTKSELASSGYYFSKGQSRAITPDSDIWLPPMKQAAAERRLVRQQQADNGEAGVTELALPLILRDEVIGVLGVKRDNGSDWATEEVSAVEAVANQIALALENARLSQEQVKTIGQLKEVDRIKSEFLTSMSHELRTPLNSIIGFADVIIQGIDGEVSEMALNDVQLIYNSGHHLLALINDILDINKIEAGMMELVQEPLDLKTVVDNTLAATKSLLNEKPKVQIVVDIGAELPSVFADKLRLNQILLNLVSNAVKFTHEGDINITARLDQDNPKMMFISVVDAGIGIPEDKFEVIFDRFSQADMATTREYGGTGLGLPICRQLVEMHGGTIGVTSEVGVGSEFFFTIPLVDAEQPA